MRSLEEILQSTSDSLFPAERGRRIIAIDSRDSDGDTPLHVIARRGDVAAVSVLLAAGANPNAIGDMGETPLHVAIAKGSIQVVNALMRNGARADIRSEFGDTGMERAMKKGSEFVRALRRGTKYDAIAE